MMYHINVWLLLAIVTSLGRSYVVDIDARPPKFATPPNWPDRSYYDENGPPIPLTCTLTSLEGVTILWYKDATLLQNTQSFSLSNDNQTLTIEVPKQNQTGTYMCRAVNRVGSVNYTGYILISARKQETRPRIVQIDPLNHVKHVGIHGNVTISCVFDVGGTDVALMDLTSTWLKNGTTLQDNSHTTFDINATQEYDQLFSLTISNFTVADYGIYACFGENQLGNDSKTIFLSPPDPPMDHQPLGLIIVGSVGGVCLVGAITMVTLCIRRKKAWNKYKKLEWLEPDLTNLQVPEHAVQYDVFISYSSNDLKWVKDVLFDNLVAKGYSVCIDFKDFTPGMAVSENIIDAIYKSRYTLVLLSSNFLKSMWGQFELQQAHNRAVIQRDDLLILIKYDKSKVPVSLMGKTFLDWSDKKVQPHFWQRLYEAIGEPGNFENMDDDHPHFENTGADHPHFEKIDADHPNDPEADVDVDVDNGGGINDIDKQKNIKDDDLDVKVNNCVRKDSEIEEKDNAEIDEARTDTGLHDSGIGIDEDIRKEVFHSINDMCIANAKKN